MARRNSIDELKAEFRALESLWLQRRSGEPANYENLRCTPQSPPAAKFIRQYATLRDALLRIRAESPSRRPDEKPFIRDGCNAVLQSLGKNPPWKYAKANAALDVWCLRIFNENKAKPNLADGRSDIAAASELLLLVPQLITAYADPRRFFTEIAPTIHPAGEVSYFDQSRLADPNEVALTLWRWGYGAMLNPDFRAAFDALRPEDLSHAIALAEGRENYRDGPSKRAEVKRIERELLKEENRAVRETHPRDAREHKMRGRKMFGPDRDASASAPRSPQTKIRKAVAEELGIPYSKTKKIHQRMHPTGRRRRS